MSCSVDDDDDKYVSLFGALFSFMYLHIFIMIQRGPAGYYAYLATMDIMVTLFKGQRLNSGECAEMLHYVHFV